MALIGTLTSGISALKSFSKGLEVIGNNIANVNTTGYKSSSASFADTFSNTLRASSSSTAAMQIGTGVQVAGVSTNYSQGSLSSTGKGTDLGISGNGYFAVKDGSNLTYATRDGSFHFDPAGDLVNSQGYNVLDVNGAKINVPDYDKVTSVSIGKDGVVSAFYSDTTLAAAYVPQTVALLKITDETKLMKQGNNLYDFSSAGSAGLDPTTATPGLTGLGSIQSGTLELSNVDLTEQFADLITTQRSFQAGSRLITVSDTVLEDIVNLKR